MFKHEAYYIDVSRVRNIEGEGSDDNGGSSIVLSLSPIHVIEG